MWWKHVPDGWGCNVETPSAELCSCRRDKHVMAFCRTKICPTRNAGDWDADVVEVGRTVQPTTHLSTPKWWKAESAWLADLHWTVYPHKWSPISCRSSAGQGKFAGQRPTFYCCTTQPMYSQEHHDINAAVTSVATYVSKYNLKSTSKTSFKITKQVARIDKVRTSWHFFVKKCIFG